MLISLHYSVQISKLSHQVKEMAQQLALLRGRVEDKADPEGEGSTPAGKTPGKD
jgi:hypothetical protein